MGLFQNFVEWGTNAKYVPLGSKCHHCGKKLGFFETGFWSINAKGYHDGALCKNCDSKVELLLKYTPTWVKKGYRSKPPFKGYAPSKRFSMNVASAKLLIDSAEAFGREELEALGTDYTSIFLIERSSVICPTALDVGVKREKLLENRIVVFGFVQLGQFKKGDTVVIPQGDGNIHTSVLEAYLFDCEENTLEIELKAHMGKQCLSQWQVGWLVLDTQEALPDSAKILR